MHSETQVMWTDYILQAKNDFNVGQNYDWILILPLVSWKKNIEKNSEQSTLNKRYSPYCAEWDVELKFDKI